MKGVDAWSAKRLPVARVGKDMTKADDEEIRAIELRFNEACGQHDPDGMVESLVDDAQFVTVQWRMDQDARGIPRPDALPARTQRAVPRASALWRQARPTPENVDQVGRDSRNVGVRVKYGDGSLVD